MRISWVAYATDDMASLANTGSAMRLGSSCSDSVSLRIARPSRIRFGRSVSIGTLRIVGVQSVVRCPSRGRACNVYDVHIVIMGCGRVGSNWPIGSRQTTPSP